MYKYRHLGQNRAIKKIVVESGEMLSSLAFENKLNKLVSSIQ